jgi:hypothetical protein
MLHQIASQIGQTEDDNGTMSQAVRDYLSAAGIGPDQYASVPAWGGALLAWSAIKSGLVPPVNPIDPLRWLDWGGALAGPQPGCIVILTEGGGRTSFLCGVAARVQARKVYVVGAFDRNVQTRAFPIEQVIAARRVPGSSVAAGPLTIEHEPVSHLAQAPTVVQIEHIPAPPQQVQLPPVAATPPTQSEASSGVEVQHLEALLSLIQDKFRQIETRIDTVQNHAIGAVKITEIAS